KPLTQGRWTEQRRSGAPDRMRYFANTVSGPNKAAEFEADCPKTASNERSGTQGPATDASVRKLRASSAFQWQVLSELFAWSGP
ncbi:hypothetical protein, partial [Mesorhizobium sp. M7A.F.Ca.CA.001.09.2.1]|uniref:hypothetical protein n=1 Tax=Mesorhizobium sp. M7A.F.Ca.CA.001.09.2.1 TaxID=2496719 RepID=UPI0019D18500